MQKATRHTAKTTTCKLPAKVMMATPCFTMTTTLGMVGQALPLQRLLAAADAVHGSSGVWLPQRRGVLGPWAAADLITRYQAFRYDQIRLQSRRGLRSPSWPS